MRPSGSNDKPTVFHLTHHKAGSQWVKEVLFDAAPRRLIQPKPYSGHLLDMPLVQGVIYPAAYMTKTDFDELVSLNSISNYRAFFVIRDLRDTLISLYFSLKYSHGISENVAKQRAKLQDMTLKQGLLFLINGPLKKQYDLQVSWYNSGVKIVKYEDLILNQEDVFFDMFDHCEIGLTPSKLKRIIRKNSFQSKSGGREPGDEDLMDHQRKGIAGDWVEYFDDQIKEQFKERYSEHMVVTGYEINDLW